MPAINLTTYKDLTEHLLDFMGANPGGDAARDARRAACGGLTCLARSSLWQYYITRGRIATVAPQNTGTVQFQASSGSYPNLLTLTGSTWPDWAGQGTVILPATNVLNSSTASVCYQVVSRINSTQIQLSTNSNPGVDLPSGTTYTLYRDTYPLPIDCTTLDRCMLVGYAVTLDYEHPGQWLTRQQIYRGPATPRFYTVRGDADYLGVMSLSFFPPPDNTYEVEFMYNRQPRALKVEAYTAGKVSISIGSNTLTGVGTKWDANRHTGTIVRLSGDGVSSPTSDVGSNPAALERVVMQVVSPTSLLLDNVAPATYTNVLHMISDAADIEPLAMRLALLRASEYQLGVARNRRDRDMLEKAWVEELLRAREADSRNFSLQSPRGYRSFPTRLADFPRGGDVS